MKTKLTNRLMVAALAALVSSVVLGASYLRLDKDFSNGATPKKGSLVGMTVAFIGDSYVQNHHRPISEAWHYLFAEKQHMRYLNFGRNGNRIIFGDPKAGTTMFKRYKEIPENVDAIVFIAGHNDASAIGKEEDPEKQKEMLKNFEKYFKEFLGKLKRDYPKAKIAFITPWGVDRPYFKEVSAIIQKETKAAKIPCFDAAGKSGIDPNSEDFRKKYFQSAQDTAHLNAAGHKLVLPKMEKFLLDALK